MDSEKEFYFVRHGQTDHNLIDHPEKGDHPEHISLNSNGRNQALAIEPIIAHLPIQTICASPLKRVQETREIIAQRLKVPHYEIRNLAECSARTWKEMEKGGMYGAIPEKGEARIFMESVKAAITDAFSFPSPSLVIAHGGVFWALCCLLGIRNEQWRIPNCGVAHFSIDNEGKWFVKNLLQSNQTLSGVHSCDRQTSSP